MTAVCGQVKDGWEYEGLLYLHNDERFDCQQQREGDTEAPK